MPRYTLALALCTVMVPLFARAEPPPEARAAEQSPEPNHIGPRLKALIDRSAVVGFSGAVLVARNGRIVASGAVGFSDLADTTPITPDALFEIASVTKQFTAAAILRLAQDGKLTLDDPIQKHLPGVPPNCGEITIRHLLQHTSGIPGSNSSGHGNDLAEVLPKFLKGGPRRRPGTRFEYWNQGYALLSEVIARTSGMSYTEYCNQFIFVPTGMTASRFTGDAAPEPSPEHPGLVPVIGRSMRGEPRSALDHPYGEYGFQYRGMGGVVSNVHDLFRWHVNLSSPDSILTAESRAKFFKPGLSDYALGWFVRTTRGRVTQSHGGGVRGFACEVRRYPEHDACIFVLANRDDAPVRQIADAAEAILFNEPGDAPPIPGPVPAELGRALAGVYRDERGNTLTITPRGVETRAVIAWDQGKFPESTSFIGVDADSTPVLYVWKFAFPLSLIYRDAESVSEVRFKSQAAGAEESRYRRVR